MSRKPVELPPLPEPLPAPTTDAHTHLTSTFEFSGLTPADAIARAEQVGVTRLVEVGTDVESSEQAIALAREFAAVVAAIAIHPNDAARLQDRLAGELARLSALAEQPGVRAIGETGLDFYRTTDASGKARQRDAFAAHLALARQHDLALVIHDRDAHDAILDVIDAEGAPDRVMMHCFSGDADFARRCLDRGFWLSFPGTITFKPNEALREALDVTPHDRLLVETDAPYLTAVPLRGKPNASYLMPLTVRYLAERRGTDLAELCTQLADNATAVFGEWGGDSNG